MNATRLVLGTVQFGMPYGISNRAGQVAPVQIASILEGARAAGVRLIDTAVGYHEAEQRLGEAGVRDFRVITKLPPLPADCDDPAVWVERTVRASLRRLGIARLHAVMLHRSRDLTGRNGTILRDALLALRGANLADRVGVSIYDPEELEEIFPVLVPDIVQAPFNVFDRRLETSGWLVRLRAAGAEVHARSLFLQGLLLMPPAARPARFAAWTPHFARWDGWLRDTGTSPLQACLGFALSRATIDGLVVGVESRRQFDEIVSATMPGNAIAPDELGSDDVELINPSRWSAA
jgi:aryl-alcohol dehydrogenase-like predicted oxidoreductase